MVLGNLCERAIRNTKGVATHRLRSTVVRTFTSHWAREFSSQEMRAVSQAQTKLSYLGLSFLTGETVMLSPAKKEDKTKSTLEKQHYRLGCHQPCDEAESSSPVHCYEHF